MDRQQIRETLKAITLTPSCINMGWAWEVEIALSEVHNGVRSVVGYLIRTTFRRPDRTTGIISTGYGGWHYIPTNADESAVVKRAYVAMEAILRHELMEAFHYCGDRIFDPHHDVQDLSAACEHREMREKLG